MKRKHFILFALFIFLSSNQLWAQEQLPYKSKAEFKTDTLQYMEYNYSTKRSVEYYKGKTVGEILSELEYPVIYVGWLTIIGFDNAASISKLKALSFCIQQVGKERSELFDYYITVYLENPPESSDFRSVIDFKNPVLTPKLYEFIKDLIVNEVGYNPYIIEKRENDLKKDCVRTQSSNISN